jgi:hypothetical protein
MHRPAEAPDSQRSELATTDFEDERTRGAVQPGRGLDGIAGQIIDGRAISNAVAEVGQHSYRVGSSRPVSRSFEPSVHAFS